MSLLIDSLIKEHLITADQAQDAREKQVGAKRPLPALLVEMGFLSEEDLLRVSSSVFHVPAVSLKADEIDPVVTKLMPYDRAKRYGVCPVKKEGDELVVAMSDPQDVVALDDIRSLTGMRVRPVLATRHEIDDAVDRAYQSDEALYDLLKNIVSDTRVELIHAEAAGKAIDAEELQGEASPVVRLVNLVLGDAVKARASDIHVEPFEHHVEIRYRIDGDLKNIMKVPKKLHVRIVARVKILSDLDIAETRKPQDGRTRIVVNGRKTDIRVSTVPAFYGEKVVMRLLSTGEGALRIDQVGFPARELAAFKEAMARPQGMILVTGPTGSGKTSTLYAALNYTKSEQKNIITIEDPVEYVIDGINQIQVNPAKNVTFAEGLRSILRQDPNVILIGEIRDRETADIAFRSAMTGHLVLSTLHTNDAASSITRLLDIGLEPYLIASSLILVLAQRLVRLICPQCKEAYTPDPKALERFASYIREFNIRTFYRGKGCEACGYTGYLGRTALIEMLPIDEKIKELIAQKATEGRIAEAARAAGMKTLAEAGAEKVAQGLTTFEEVVKVVEMKEAPRKAAAAPEEVPPPPPPAPAVPEGKPRVLVADDEEDILKILEKRLTAAGYEVLTARDGKEEVELACRERPDLIITDVMMPNMDGYEATKAIRSRLETAGIPVLMLTAKKDTASEVAGFDAGADDYLTKPFESEKLLARVKMLLKRGAKQHA